MPKITIPNFHKNMFCYGFENDVTGVRNDG